MRNDDDGVGTRAVHPPGRARRCDHDRVPQCFLCRAPNVEVLCPPCTAGLEQRRDHTDGDLHRALSAIRDAARVVGHHVIFGGSDGPRRLVREVLPMGQGCLAGEDARRFTELMLTGRGDSVLALAFHGQNQVAQQYDVLVKELAVLADLVRVPTGWYAAPSHLRTVLHAAAMVILLTNPNADFETRLGCGLNHTLTDLRARHREVGLWAERETEADDIEEIAEHLLGFAEHAGLPIASHRHEQWVHGVAHTETRRIADAFGVVGGVDAGADYGLLSSAVHGHRRRYLNLLDEMVELDATDANPMAVTLDGSSRALYLALRATSALVEYTGVPGAAAKERRLAHASLAWLVLIGERERKHLQREVDALNVADADGDAEQ